jgi:hypothetical protein
MRKLFTFLAPIAIGILLTASVFAQTPEKMSYQAVIRDASDNLITDTQVGMQISILQGSASGTAVYVETQEPTTNANGLVSIEIGTGTVESGDFMTIDWANGTYFIKTETAVEAPLTTYTITGTSQLLSVPYALHAKTAETVSGGITETDPTFTSSQAANITATDITNLSNLSGVNTGDQDISGIATNATAISTIDTEQITQNDAIALNTAKTGITTAQANAIIANTGKDTTGIYHANRTALDAVSGVNTGDQDISGIATNATAISTIETEQTTQNDAIALNTAKTGITTAQANAIIANTGKDTTGIYHANRTALDAVSGTNTGDQDGSETKVTAGTNVTVTGSGTVASPYVVNATGGGSSNDFYLGQDTLGGIVFYIYLDQNGNQHGLIVSKTETTAKWQNTGVTTNATRSWDGAYNMNLMSDSPAKDWVTGNFSTDWYLPSIDELSILWHNRFHANKGLNDASATLLSNTASYWSSTEYHAAGAFPFYFDSGDPSYGSKVDTHSVRAVRAF